jgi:flagellar motor protein MotB
MRWLSAVGLGLVGVLALVSLASVGCVSQQEYDVLMMRNREQDKQLQDKEAELAKLSERVEALTARGSDAQKLLDDKLREVQESKAEKDRILRAFTDLRDAYIRLANSQQAGMGATGGIPGPVAVAIEDLQSKYGNLFVFDKDKGRLRFSSDITFDSGSNVVKPEAKAALTKLAQILNGGQARDLALTIVGHTDSDAVKKPETIARLKQLGKSTDNMGLSEARAESVAEVLKAGGIDAGRMITQGKGQTEPLADNDKAKNRRVEIYLTPGAGGAITPAATPAAPATPPIPLLEK